jgi:hypothetical protein
MFVYCGRCVSSGRVLITRPEMSYRLWCVVVCDLETSRMRRPDSNQIYLMTPFLKHVLCTFYYIEWFLRDKIISISIYLEDNFFSFIVILYSCLGMKSADSQLCKCHVKLYSNRPCVYYRMGRHNIHAQLHGSLIDHFFIFSAKQGLNVTIGFLSFSWDFLIESSTLYPFFSLS